MEIKLDILYIGRLARNIGLLLSHPEITLNHCSNAQEAINTLESGKHPDAVLSEEYISGGCGIEMHEWLRKRPEFNRISFILLSHEFKADLIKDAFEVGVDDFFVYPLPEADSMIGRIRFLAEYRKKLTLSAKNSTNKLERKYEMPLSKRLFDLFVAITALILLSPVLLLVIIAIRIESKGKVYYISKRVGRETFDFYKLRSMRIGADKELDMLAKDKNQYSKTTHQAEIDFSKPCPCYSLPEDERCSPMMHMGNHTICDRWYLQQKKEVAKTKSAFIKIEEDPRVTKVGKFIRNTSIDELPQLINVIKGDMSIVGNRPLPVYEAELLTRGQSSKRFLAPAGITGLWQVELRGRGGRMHEDERMKLDNEYADHFAGENYSFWYDLKLILRTIPALFQKDSV